MTPGHPAERADKFVGYGAVLPIYHRPPGDIGNRQPGYFPVKNLGTGQGYSVLEVVAAASAAVGREIPYVVGPRRAGDVPAIWADPTLAQELLGWKAGRTLADMCADHWRWQSANPDGYGGPEAATTP